MLHNYFHEQYEQFSVNLDTVMSNMVYISCDEGQAQLLVDNLSKEGIDILTINDSTVRAVIHLHITDEDIDRTINAFKNINN